MIYRLLFKFQLGDGLFFLAVSAAAYHNTSAMWLWYAIYLSATIAFVAFFRDVASWLKYLGDAIEFHAECIRDKTLRVHHSGQVKN